MTKITEGTIPFLGHETYYRIAGDLSSGKTPLLCLHGGPGSTHNYFEIFDELGEERPVISYDQIGCGNSYLDHHPGLWNKDTWTHELETLRIALHLDHGDTFELCKNCIDGGFTSVMIDASSKSFEDNIALTKQVVEYAHAHGVVVEAELGTLEGVEDEVVVEAGKASYTRPEEVEEFVTRTGCDSLAIAIGTSHGAYKFKPEQCTRNADGILVPPPLRFDVLVV